MIEQIKEQIKENARDYISYGRTLDDAISLAIDDIHYYDDLWDIMAVYQCPQDADLAEALELLYDDVYNEMRGYKK